MLTIAFQLSDSVSATSASNNFAGTPIPGVAIRACTSTDFECTSAIATGTTDETGTGPVTVPYGFNGYFEARAPSGYPPFVIKRTPQRFSERATNPLTRSSSLAGGALIVGVSLDLNLALAIITAEDCNSAPSSGIQFDVGPLAENEQLVYVRDLLPDTTATETDAVGAAFMFNVPPGALAVTAKFADTHRPIGTVSALVRPGWLTFANIRLDQAKPLP